MVSKEAPKIQPASPMEMQKAVQLDTLLGHFLPDKQKQESYAAKYFQQQLPPDAEGNVGYLNVGADMIEGEAETIRQHVNGFLFKDVAVGKEHVVNHRTGASYERTIYKTEIDEQGRQIVDSLRQKHLAAWGVIFPAPKAA